jgi:hypothetical protein
MAQTATQPTTDYPLRERAADCAEAMLEQSDARYHDASTNPHLSDADRRAAERFGELLGEASNVLHLAATAPSHLFSDDTRVTIKSALREAMATASISGNARKGADLQRAMDEFEGK